MLACYVHGPTDGGVQGNAESCCNHSYHECVQVRHTCMGFTTSDNTYYPTYRGTVQSCMGCPNRLETFSSLSSESVGINLVFDASVRCKLVCLCYRITQFNCCHWMYMVSKSTTMPC